MTALAWAAGTTGTSRSLVGGSPYGAQAGPGDAEAPERLRSESVAANRMAARFLHSAGWSHRLNAKAMPLVHQRVEQ
jgi:hypothetical protein